MSVKFAPVTLPANRHPDSTSYGFMIDHLWDNPGVNVARRPQWPAGMYISVQPFDEAEIEAMGDWAMESGVFFDDDIEYGSPAEDMAADDWETAIVSDDDDEGGAFVLI